MAVLLENLVTYHIFWLRSKGIVYKQFKDETTLNQQVAC